MSDTPDKPTGEVDYRLARHFDRTRNERAVKLITEDKSPMIRRILNGELVNLSGFPRRGDGGLVLPFLPDNENDYCDLENNILIWSIIREHSTGEIVAFTGIRDFEHSAYQNLWTR